MKRAHLFGALLCLSGCALTSKAPPLAIRYFSPEHFGQRSTTSQPAPPPSASPVRLKLGSITSSAHLRLRIAYRISTWELGEYETLRWTENPEMYLRRTLEAALFERHPIVRAVAGPAPALDIELVHFEEVREGRRRAARIVLRYVIRDERSVLTSGTLDIERDAAQGDGIAAVVAALAAALDEIALRVADLAMETVAPGHDPANQSQKSSN